MTTPSDLEHGVRDEKHPSILILPWWKQWRTSSRRRWCLWVISAVVLALALLTIPIVLDDHVSDEHHRTGITTRAVSSSSASSVLGAVVDSNFADPCYITDGSTHYAFATNRFRENQPGQVHIQLATSHDFANWSLSAGYDALPDAGLWTTNTSIWGPDVVRRDDGSFVMYYTAHTSTTRIQCIGAALADRVQGPYAPLPTPLLCPSSDGGAIDPEAFRDADGTRYLVYKVDGNSLGGDTPTPLMLQQLATDAVTPIGSPVRLLDRDSSDGPLIEAPAMGRYEHDGEPLYVLFFSSHMFDGPEYDVKYATSTSVRGPFVRASEPLLQSANSDVKGLIGPGGMDVGVDGLQVVFHSITNGTMPSDPGDSPLERTMGVGRLTIDGRTVKML